MTNDQDQRIRAALEKIEAARKARGISVRAAAEKIPNISESYWRQFVAGGVSQAGIWIPRIPSLDQLVKMAGAVGVGSEVAQDLGVEEPSAPTTVMGQSELKEIRAQLQAILERLSRIDG